MTVVIKRGGSVVTKPKATRTKNIHQETFDRMKPIMAWVAVTEPKSISSILKQFPEFNIHNLRYYMKRLIAHNMMVMVGVAGSNRNNAAVYDTCPMWTEHFKKLNQGV